MAALGIHTWRDLLFYFPRDYQDRRTISPIAQACEGEVVIVEAEVSEMRAMRLRGRSNMARGVLKDASGSIAATWFGQGYLARVLTPGKRAIFFGLVGKYKGLCLQHPEFELLTGDEDDLLHTGRIVPIYKLTEGVTQRMLRAWVRSALDALSEPLAETLPKSLRKAYALPKISPAIRAVHFPDSLETAREARDRFAYEELLGIQLGILSERAHRREETKPNRHIVDGSHLQALRDTLPFTLTQGQQQAVQDILEDLDSPRPMARLLQGDVGCGKTAVALHAIAAAADGGYQTALMAPTEILAEQHYATLHVALEPLGLRVELLTGSTPDAYSAREAIADGRAEVIIGTHALIQDRIEFHKLGLAVIDEQHRFGVVQRSALVEKGLMPDMLHMTATPIPRTLAITVYGGMELSIIQELPPGRQPIKTRRITPAKLEGMYGYIREQAEAGLQTYYVCPLVEASEKKQLADVTSFYDELVAGPLHDLRLGLLHGRLRPEEKEVVMLAFKNGELDVLVSTSVIEVGIDVPTATTMVIEDASQFGLTQLHQLRGRIGRGEHLSHCFLLGKPKTKDGAERLRVLCEHTSGFDIAEADLKLRGPGEFRGVRQAGLSDLRIADLIRDVRLLDRARQDAQAILNADPSLAAPGYEALRAAAERFESFTA
jgi:ATP-dependent DNA helicase RecG